MRVQFVVPDVYCRSLSPELGIVLLTSDVYMAEHQVQGRAVACGANPLAKCVEMAVAMLKLNDPDVIPVVVHPSCQELKERIPFKHVCVQPEAFPCPINA